MEIDPSFIQPVDCPVSCSRELYSEIEYLIRSVRFLLERSARTWAAECQVVPEVS